MKKLLLTFFCLAVTTSFAFCEGLDRVYIGANLSMSFEDFRYDEYINSLYESKGGDKTLSGPRYDFVAGIRLGNKVRVEGQYMIISANDFKTDKTESDVEYKAQALFANVIYDFWNMKENLITPFIGAGAGVSSPNLNISYNGIKEQVEDKDFSWQLQGGINLMLLEWLFVNIKYSYISMPNLDVQLTSVDEIKTQFKQGVQAIGAGITLVL